MFMAAISKGLEMGLASSRVFTASASASLLPFSAESAAALEAGAEAAGLAAEEAAEEAVEEEPPQPESRAQLTASAAVVRISFERFLMDYSLFCVLTLPQRAGYC